MSKKENKEFKAALDELKENSVFLSSYFSDISIEDTGYIDQYSKFYKFAKSKKNKDTIYGQIIKNYKKFQFDSGFCSTVAISTLLDLPFDTIYDRQIELSREVGVTYNCGIITSLCLKDKYKMHDILSPLNVADVIHMYQNKYERYLIGNADHLIAVTDHNTIHDHIIYDIDEIKSTYHLNEEYGKIYGRYILLTTRIMYAYLPI